MKIDLSKIDANLEVIGKGEDVLVFFDINSCSMEMADHMEGFLSQKFADKKIIFIGFDVPMNKTVEDTVALYKVEKK